MITDSAARTQRATAMPPDERRAAIIAATLPLVLEHGSAVSTRMIARAAGIAEGTIFRVFPDKETLIEAVVEAAFDPEPMERAFAQIDRSLSVERRLSLGVEIVQARIADIWRLASTVGVDKVPEDRRRPTDVSGLASLFHPDEALVNRDASTAARMLRSLTLAFSHPMLVPEGPMRPDEIVALLLDGIRTRPNESTRAGES